jgi:hypothetical protein
MGLFGPKKENDQKVSGMVQQKSTPSNIFGYTPSSSSAQTRRQAKVQDKSAFTDGRKANTVKKGIASPSAPSLSGSKIESSPITTRKVAGKNTGRLARKADKLRGKGEDALASGNLRKAKRLRRRYDRQTSRMNKSMSNASSGYGMQPGSKNVNSPTTFNNKHQSIINDVNKNFDFKTDI